MTGSAHADIAAVQSEPNAERRSERALEYANQALSTARKEYDAGRQEQFRESLHDVQAAAELCLKSLEDSGKSARRYPKFFKKAELNTRTLLRRIESLRQEVGVDDRDTLDKLKGKVDEVHDRLVQDLMEKKK